MVSIDQNKHHRILLVALVLLGAGDLGLLRFLIVPRIIDGFADHSVAIRESSVVNENESQGIKGGFEDQEHEIEIKVDEIVFKNSKEDQNVAPPSKIQILPTIVLPDLSLVDERTRSGETRGSGPTRTWMIFFPTNAATLEKDDFRTAWKVLGHLKARTDLTLLIRGHSDKQGRLERNMHLSFQRAESVRNWLIAHGASPKRIEIEGVGWRRLLDDSSESHAKNRRVEFIWKKAVIELQLQLLEQ
jgi:outer membrane protein OmpA-like peptidoglycan-associated protein